MIVFYKMMEREKEEGERKSFPFLRYSNVFHISQCEGIKTKLEPITPNTDIEPIETAQSIINSYVERSQVKLKLVEGSNWANYSPLSDEKVLPAIGQFESAEEFYSEIASAMLMNISGIEIKETFSNSAAYINYWL